MVRALDWRRVRTNPPLAAGLPDEEVSGEWVLNDPESDPVVQQAREWINSQ